MKNRIIKSAAILILSGLSLPGALSFAAEFEVLDKFSVDGYSVLKGSADIPGGSFTVGGSTFVVQDGKVGVGTVSPIAKLQVNDTTFPQVRVQNDNGGAINGEAGIRFRSQGTSGTAHADMAWLGTGSDAGNLIFRVPYYSERMRIQSDGSVGIGTTGPAANLEVMGRIRTNSSDYARFESARNGALIWSVGLRTGDDYYIYRESGAGNILINGANVGIGTTGPAFKLDVYGGDLHVGDGNNFNPLIQNAGSGRVPGSPGYSFLNDPDTGLFHPNTMDILAFATAGTEWMRIDNTGNVGIGTTSPVAKFDVGGTDAIKIPVGTTDQRPASPAIGMVRLNITTGRLEFYNGAWVGIGAIIATGGTVTEVGGYRIHTFNASGTFTVTIGGNIEVLVVAGGGSGGTNGGGGGAGGLIYNAAYAAVAGPLAVTVGAGGTGGHYVTTGANGGNSIFGSITATGGGHGGTTDVGASGGSGGGGGYPDYGMGSGISGQGNNGAAATGGTSGNYGGGGGAGTAASGMNGGNGLTYWSVTYAGGGGGGRQSGSPAGSGGTGGGGNGNTIEQTASHATANTGGGGGGSAGGSGISGNGGSGIVIVRYPI